MSLLAKFSTTQLRRISSTSQQMLEMVNVPLLPLLCSKMAPDTLEETATANDRTNAWARENDATATCKKLEGDRKRHRLDPTKEDNETESAVKEVNQYSLSKTEEHTQELEKQTSQLLRQAARPQGRYRRGSGSFWSTPVAGEE